MKTVGLLVMGLGLGGAVVGCASNSANRAANAVQAAQQTAQAGQAQVQSARQQFAQAAGTKQTPTVVISEAQAAAQRAQSFKGPQSNVARELAMRIAAGYQPVGLEWDHIYDPNTPPAPRTDTIPKKPANAVKLVAGTWMWAGARWVWIPTHWVVSK